MAAAPTAVAAEAARLSLCPALDNLLSPPKSVGPPAIQHRASGRAQNGADLTRGRAWDFFARGVVCVLWQGPTGGVKGGPVLTKGVAAAERLVGSCVQPFWLPQHGLHAQQHAPHFVERAPAACADGRARENTLIWPTACLLTICEHTHIRIHTRNCAAGHAAVRLNISANVARLQSSMEVTPWVSCLPPGSRRCCGSRKDTLEVGEAWAPLSSCTSRGSCPPAGVGAGTAAATADSALPGTTGPSGEIKGKGDRRVVRAGRAGSQLLFEEQGVRASTGVGHQDPCAGDRALGDLTPPCASDLHAAKVPVSMSKGRDEQTSRLLMLATSMLQKCFRVRMGKAQADLMPSCASNLHAVQVPEGRNEKSSGLLVLVATILRV
eukprot:scaffold146229_cov19-Tisochrysis_lutea.AAC.1